MVTSIFQLSYYESFSRLQNDFGCRKLAPTLFVQAFPVTRFSPTLPPLRKESQKTTNRPALGFRDAGVIFSQYFHPATRSVFPLRKLLSIRASMLFTKGVDAVQVWMLRVDRCGYSVSTGIDAACRQAWLRGCCASTTSIPFTSAHCYYPPYQLEVLHPRIFSVATKPYIMTSDTDVKIKTQPVAQLTPRARESFSLTTTFSSRSTNGSRGRGGRKRDAQNGHPSASQEQCRKAAGFYWPTGRS